MLEFFYFPIAASKPRHHGKRELENLARGYVNDSRGGKKVWRRVRFGQENRRGVPPYGEKTDEAVLNFLFLSLLQHAYPFGSLTVSTIRLCSGSRQNRTLEFRPESRYDNWSFATSNNSIYEGRQ